jgi:hypothetical protein
MDAEEEYDITTTVVQDNSAQGSASPHHDPDIGIDDLFPVRYNNFEHILSECQRGNGFSFARSGLANSEPGTNPKLPEPQPHIPPTNSKYSPRIQGLPHRCNRRAKAPERMSDPLDSYVSQNLSRHHSERKHLQTFNGAVIDTGASKSIIGVKQARAYCVSHKLRMNAQPSSTRFRFADQICSSLGRIKISIPTPDTPMDV